MYNQALPYLLGRLKDLPTMLIWGEQDGVVPISAGEVYRDAIQGATLEIISNCAEIKDRDIKTIRWINKEIIIKNKIFAKQIIDRSIGADISINSPSKDISCLEILWFATNEDINDV